MSNLAEATNPHSKIVSAESLSVAPDPDMLLVNVAVKTRPQAGGAVDSVIPIVDGTDDGTLAFRIGAAVNVAREMHPPRIAIVLPGTTWEDAGVDRSAQHFAITLLDALCAALS